MVLLAILVVVFFVDATLGAQCACATTSVHVRNDAGLVGSILSTITKGECYPYYGDTKTSGGYTWDHIDFRGQSAWIARNYVTIETCHHGGGSAVQLSGCPNIISRSQWGAAPSAHPLHKLPGKPTYVFIHHSDGRDCMTESTCATDVKGIQHFHIHGRGWNDIGYSFLIGGDGNAYEGRGWDHVGAHTKGYNTVGLAFCMLGTFINHLPDQKALNTVKQMIQCGVTHGKIQPNYHLLGHRDVNPTACPGQDLYNLIRTWPHYGKP